MSNAIHGAMTAKEWAMLLALSVLWGGSFFFVGVAVRELPPFTIVTVRVALAALALLIITFAIGERLPRTAAVWCAFISMGLLNNLVPFTLIVWGQTHIASGLASILNATTPLFSVLVAHALTTDERLSSTRLFGVLAGLAGTVILIGPAVLGDIGGHALAQTAILAAALSYAFAGVYGRRFHDMGVSPLATATGQLIASTILLLPLAILIEMPWQLPAPSRETWAALVGLALLSTALAYVLYFRILATAGATNLLLVTFLIPITAILLGVLLLGEQLNTNQIVGMACIGLGLAAIDGRPAKWIVRQRHTSQRR